MSQRDAKEAQPKHFVLGNECALTLAPSSEPDYETLTLLDGDNVLKLRLTADAKSALAMTVCDCDALRSTLARLQNPDEKILRPARNALVDENSLAAAIKAAAQAAQKEQR